ncbi:S9 family peptidase [Sphingomonas sp. R647]|uniref:alpha/beta hydrolase family protein n=1 Tax=Sphingomonas sp. R647 TaxID=2875233 RepID=UPI001CD7DA82|nr:S9 family peptidase [Sphingomonas sp. R647]MCA1198359.1 S9 family peptidase [Sphingomonas sp. R647]
MRFSIMWAALAVAAAPAAAQGFDAAKAFGARESIAQVSLSPDGTRIVYVSPHAGRGSAIYVAKLDGSAPPVRVGVTDGKPDRVGYCRWASNTRLLCSTWGIITNPLLMTVSRLVAMDADGKNVQVIEQPGTGRELLGSTGFGGAVIDWNPGTDGSVLMMRGYVPEYDTGTRLAQTKRGVGVDLIDVTTMKVRNVERPAEDAARYITDGRGNVRIIARIVERDGYSIGPRLYSFRRKDKQQWEALSRIDTTNQTDPAFTPQAVDPTLDIAYGFKRHQGRLAVFSKALDGSGTETLVYAHPNVDVDGLVRIGRNNRVVGVSYSTDKTHVHYFDKDVATLRTMLGRALPKLPMLDIVDSSEDEKRMLVWAGSDTDPGRYFLFDRTTKQLSELMLTRPELEAVALGTMRSVSYPAADGTMIPAYLTMPAGSSGKNIPAIVLPHGGPGARDYWGFDWLSQYFASQGFAVLQPNFRGSAGYGDAWFQRNGFQDWRVAIGDVADAGRWLVKQGIADPAELNILGWSYGGYAALQSAVVDPDLFKRVVAIAPVTDLEKLKSDNEGYSSFVVVSRFVGSGPHVVEGSPARHAAKIKAPVLMFHGDMDQNVAIGQARLMQDKMKSAGGRSELVEYPGLDHYLEDSGAREEMLRKTAAFLKAPVK